MSAVHYKKIKGKEYAYDIISYRDKETKKVKKKYIYLGRVMDKENKIFKKMRSNSSKETCPRSSKETCPRINSININNNNINTNANTNSNCRNLILDYGATYCIDKVFKESNLYAVFSDVFRDNLHTLMNLINFRIQASSAMQYANIWYEGNYASILYPNANTSSQRITDFLRMLGNEELQRNFFRAYLDNLREVNNHTGETKSIKTSIIVDSTGLPNEINFPLTAWGHHGSGCEEETRLLMVIDKLRNIPLYFRFMAGNIVDVSTLHTTIEELKQYDIKTSFSLVDAGYYSEDNINYLYENKIDFLTRLPSNRILYKELIDKYETKEIEKAENRVIYGNRVLFIKKVKINLFQNNTGYTYIALDVKKCSEEISKYIISAEEDNIPENEIDNNLKYKGKFIFISSNDIDIKDLMHLYYTRQSIENMFGIVKNNLSILPLRIHSIETFRGYIFFNFLCLITYLNLKNKLKNKYTVEDFILTMNNLKCKVFDSKLIIQEETKKMKEILKLIDK
jgi:transposase